MLFRSKVVEQISAPIPLELHAFGIVATERRLGRVTRRDAPLSPDGGIIADYHGSVDDPAITAAYLAGCPGVVDHGLFAPDLTATIIVAAGSQVSVRDLRA